MSNHQYAVIFAIIGLIVAGLITEFSAANLICGLCFGTFAGYFIAGLTKAKGNILHEDFVALGNLRGRTLQEIKDKVGPPNTMQSCTAAETGRPGVLYTWASDPYSITLLFDENDICLGVNKESLTQ